MESKTMGAGIGRRRNAERRFEGWPGRLGLMVLSLWACAAGAAWGYDPPEDTAGPLSVRIEGPPTIARLEVPQAYKVVLHNRGSQLLRVDVRLQLIDDWRSDPQGPAPVELAAGGTAAVQFGVTAGSGTYAAHYPIHALASASDGQQTWTAHPILIVEAQVAGAVRTARPLAWQPWKLSAPRGLALWRLPLHRAVFTVRDSPPQTMPTAWTGSEPESRGSVLLQSQQLDAATREAIAIHPPWFAGRTGTAWIEYPLELPATTPIRLRVATAVTPVGAGDGVTFRVRIADWQAAEGQAGEVVFQRHSAAQSWEPAEVDLSRFAGRTVRLQLESHPGPENNTAFDQSYWAEPTLLVGEPPAEAAFPPDGQQGSERLGSLAIAGQVFEVRVWPGPRGLLDACVGLLSDRGQLYLRGFRTRVMGQRLDDPASPVELVETIREPAADGLQIRHRFATAEGPLELVIGVFVENHALRVRFRLAEAPQAQPWFAPRIEELAVDRFSQPATRVYAGHGNVIVQPEAFRLGFDGHRLATSHVGFDFANGVSLVQAVDLPPEALVVDPAAGHFSLHTAHDATFTLIPAANVWQAARHYRETSGMQASGGVQRLAGRFVFDLWGGRYGQSGEELQRAFRYGLTDAAVIWHNWQRWGYDYRLPEIYPPNPRLGSEQELAQLIEACRQADVLFALHDNYIDFYPDAEGFSYQRAIAFTPDGKPVRAWLNEGREAQSYRYRADQVEPILQANLDRIAAQLHPTSYFIDVWSSIAPYDYWTAEGRFFDRSGTRDSWGRHFAWIRQRLGADAPQISESGHDQLIGWLDGAQANHLRVGRPLPGDYSWSVWDIRCQDAERTCWFDFAHHDRFVLHGAGYSVRYQAGLDARLHGIYSDDYLATEILTGHPAMVSGPFGRDVVRKYWLTQPVLRGLALRNIEDVEFVEGDIHRQQIRWSGGGRVWVNRGESDWQIEESVLPAYGFLAEVPIEGGLARCELVRHEGLIVERSSSPDQLYVNGRQLAGEAPIAGRVMALRSIAPDRVALDLELQSRAPIPPGYRLFLHFLDSEEEITFQGASDQTELAGLGAGPVRMTAAAVLPATGKAGDTWELRLGFYHPGRDGQRLPVQGPEDGQRRLRLGSLQLTAGRPPENVRWVGLEGGEDPWLARQNPAAKPLDFGPVITAGACRISQVEGGVLLVPLPESHTAASQYTLRWDQLPWSLPAPTWVESLDEQQRVLERQPAVRPLTVRAKEGVFAYRFTSR